MVRHLLGTLVAGVVLFWAGYAVGGAASSESGAEAGVRVIDEYHIQIEPKEFLYIQVGKETITCQDQSLLPPHLRRVHTCSLAKPREE
jgi:hypothetical protein